MFGVPDAPGLGIVAFCAPIAPIAPIGPIGPIAPIGPIVPIVPSESKGAIDPGGIELALGTPKDPTAAADPAAAEGKEWGRAG